MSTNNSNQLIKDFMLGGGLGAVAKTATAPMERVKLLMQTSKSNLDIIQGKVKPYASNMDCARRVLLEQGVLGFWRGNLVNCLRYGPQQGSALAFNDFLNNVFPHYNANTDFWKSFGVRLMSGGLAGAISNTLSYPFDFARTRLATDVKKGAPKFKGIMDCLATTFRQQGIVGLYTGWTVTVLGAFVYRAGQLGCFKQIQDMNPYKNDSGRLGAISSFIAVTVARSIVLPLNYPFDTVRRRMMLESEKPLVERLYKGSVDCFRQVMRQEGFKGIYAGLGAEFFRGIAGSLVIVGYDRIKLLLN